jgi:hypothetical protein
MKAARTGIFEVNSYHIISYRVASLPGPVEKIRGGGGLGVWCTYHHTIIHFLPISSSFLFECSICKKIQWARMLRLVGCPGSNQALMNRSVKQNLMLSSTIII